MISTICSNTSQLPLVGFWWFHVNEPFRDRLAAKCLDILDSYNLAQHVTEHKRKGTMDLIITRATEDIVLNYNVEDPDLSDHYAVHCMLSLDKPTANARLSIDGRNPSRNDALYKSATTGASSKANNFQIIFGIASGPCASSILMAQRAMYASLGVTRRQFGISCTGMLLTSCGVRGVNGDVRPTKYRLMFSQRSWTDEMVVLSIS